MKILYIAPYPPAKTGIADYSVAFKQALEKYASVKMEVLDPAINADELGKKLKETKYDLIQIELGYHTLREFWLAYKIAKLKISIPVSITVHDPPFLVGRLIGGSQPKGKGGSFLKSLLGYTFGKWLNKVYLFLQAPYKNILENKIIERANLVLALTEKGSCALKSRFKGKDLNKIHIIPHLTVSDQIKMIGHKKMGDQKILLHFGYVTFGKGLDTSIEALRFLAKERHDFVHKIKLWIGGDVPEAVRDYAIGYKNSIKKKIENCNLKELVEWKGYIPEKNIEEIFSCADLLILPYESGPSFSTSGVIIRAMGYGLPIIASDVRGFSDEIRDGMTGLLFKEKDGKELAHKILMVLEDEDLSKRLRENAFYHVSQEHEWEKVAKRVVSFYNQLIGSCHEDLK